MIYTDFKGEKLSMLGMGCMRFPTDENGEVDMAKTAEMIDLCMKSGINYYDSAYLYHKGKSEEIMGKLLSKYPRESFNFATKMPWFVYETKEEMEALFENQLKNTGFDYFDFYLFHNVSDKTVSVYTDEKFSIFEFLVQKKKEGKIRHLGFSTHASLGVMEDFIKKYGHELEFCQIQLNWLDYTLQNAKEKVELLNKYNLPIWVMEPLRGGKLASLLPDEEELLKSQRPCESIASWSFRYLQSFGNIKMILSGMSDIGQISDNIKTFGKLNPLSDSEKQTLYSIADRILAKKTLACTGCRYCVDKCPSELDIPKLLSLYNSMCLINNNPSAETVKNEVQGGSMPQDCIGCRACEGECPQNINISEIMHEFSTHLA